MKKWVKFLSGAVVASSWWATAIWHDCLESYDADLIWGVPALITLIALLLLNMPKYEGGF
jgi:hypothetical protein